MVDILLNSLLVLESFFSFFSSFFSSGISKLCEDWLRGGPPAFDSLIRRPNDLQLLSEDDRGGFEMGEVGSIFDGLCLELLEDGLVDADF